MARTSKKQLLDDYKDSLDTAKRWRRQLDLDATWRRLNDLYRGRHFPEGMSAEDQIVVNVAFATINVIAPSVAINYPKTVVTARQAEDYDKATIVEEVVNYWWRKYDILPEFQSAVKDYLIYGFGWIKTGYRFEEEEQPRKQGEIDEEFETARFEADEYAMANPHLAGGLPTDDEIMSTLSTTNRVTVVDAPFVERVSPHDVFVDPEATSLRDARWIAHRVVKTKQELKDAGYKTSAVNDAQADSRGDEAYFSNNPWNDEPGTKAKNEKAERYTVWEFYNLNERTMCVFADSGEGYLLDPEPMPYKFGHPFVMLRNYDIPDVFYPMGELEALEPLQHELNMTRSAMFNDRKQYRRAWLYRPEAFDSTGRAQLESDEDNRLIPVAGNMPLGDALIPLPGQQVNPQLYQDSSVIEGDITSVTGMNEYMRGVAPEVRRTATEASIIQDVASARAAEKLAKVEKAIGEISRRLVVLAQQFMTEEQAARVVSVNTPKPVWFKFSPEDIEGEFDFEVQGGSTKPLNESARRQTAVDMLQALAPYGDPQLGIVNMQAVIAYALEFAFDVKDVGKFMGQGPPQPEPKPKVLGDGQPAPPEEGMPPEGMPPEGMPPEMMGGGEGGVPPELAMALAAQGGGPLG